MKPLCADFIFESELIRIKEILPDALVFVTSHFPFISEDDLFDLRLVYSELLINAVVHGNKEDPSKKVALTIIPRGNEIISIIKDEGSGFDYQKALNAESCLYDLLSEHGKGLRLVRSLTESLRFNNLGNEIVFRKRILYNRDNDISIQAAILKEAAVI